MNARPISPAARSVAHVDLAAIVHNVERLAERAGPAEVCAVVKADGYGHGAVQVAEAALVGGASWLAVANVAEAAVLRAAGIEAPILVLSEITPDAHEMDRALALRLDLVAYRPDFLDLVSARARHIGIAPAAIHLKIDTGMRRVGCEPDTAVSLARRIVEDPHLRLAGTMTHLATADEPGNPTTDRQLDRFDEVLAAMAAAGIDPGRRHAANSAATMIHPRARLDLVRVGIAVYGIPPAPALAAEVALRPALRWTARVGFVKPVRAGEAVSYGHRHVFERDTTVATVTAGYADGVRRRLGLVGGQVLVGGVRRAMVGVVTMDQLVVDVGSGPEVSVDDEVVLVGCQGDEEITAAEVAGLLDTIGYEITCGVSPRVDRRYA